MGVLSTDLNKGLLKGHCFVTMGAWFGAMQPGLLLAETPLGQLSPDVAIFGYSLVDRKTFAWRRRGKKAPAAPQPCACCLWFDHAGNSRRNCHRDGCANRRPESKAS